MAATTAMPHEPPTTWVGVAAGGVAAELEHAYTAWDDTLGIIDAERTKRICAEALQRGGLLGGQLPGLPIHHAQGSQRVAVDHERYAKVIKEFGIQPE